MSHKLLEDGIISDDPKVRAISGEGLHDFLLHFYYKNPEHHPRLKELINMFCCNIKSRVLATRQGYASALGT